MVDDEAKREGTSRLRLATARAVFDRLPYAIIIVDEFARAVVLNDAARTGITTRRGLRLEAGVIRAADEGDNAQLRASIEIAARVKARGLTGVGALRIGDGPVTTPLLVLPSYLDGDPLLNRCGFAFVVFGGDGRVAHRQLLVEMYHFTRREADLAYELIAGRTLPDAARVLQVTSNTARTHLRHVLEKTATSRQGDLVRVLIQSSPPCA